MIAVLLSTAALALWAVVATVELVSRDGYSAIPTRDFRPSPLIQHVL